MIKIQNSTLQLNSTKIHSHFFKYDRFPRLDEVKEKS